MSKISYLTQEGFDKLKANLEELKTTGRQEMARAIGEAREKGDLSENAEYDAAKDAQGMLEMKINELETALATARVIDISQIDTSKVTILSNVTIRNKKTKKDMTYTFVLMDATLQDGQKSISFVTDTHQDDVIKLFLNE